MTDPTAPAAPPAAMTATKTWWSALMSALVTAGMTTYTVAGDAFKTLWDWVWCSAFAALACPDPGAVPAALKAIVGTFADQWWKALIAGGLVGGITYLVPNKMKET